MKGFDPVDLSRYLRKEHIKLNLNIVEARKIEMEEELLNAPDPDDEDYVEPEPPLFDDERIIVDKNLLLEEMVSLISDSPLVKHEKRLLKVIIDREGKTSTGIGSGVAIPHGRTHEVRDFIMGLAICREGVEFDALDHKPVHLIFLMASPPDNDTLYLKILKNLTQLIRDPSFRQRLINCGTVDEAYFVLKSQV
ncbi:MAG: hypothetical protein CVV64_11100 [Candidatus Wallbacteria bacterium HGW-Wallbacteria-1]|jgi:mannitol/fructose-specific phosphotransferase system IIA component (Ntr-type)|uniref:PTS EIIA type-2 domain-containing protein n=1 Tax=Candidatus Wallbacteria bacterium HGW-Wallbacteria-1 TaxID=2013854 RepID=A0A2N1PP00_9BACT|nr:MAG: hypothetical protein CVV64_11100 [Candidatus Wallbacteria bacterium HGW-Wallbacteria-1]